MKLLVKLRIHGPSWGEKDDNREDINYVLNKLVSLRLFPNDEGKFHYSISQMGGQILLVSQFTLCANLAQADA